MNNSADKNILGVFPRNKTGGIHYLIFLISPTKKKLKNKIKKDLKSHKISSVFRGRRLIGLNKDHGFTMQIL